MKSKNLFSKLKDIAHTKTDNWLDKAKGGLNDSYSFRRKSIYMDSTEVTSSGVWEEKPALISFDILRQVATSDMVVAAIINKLVNRVASFSKPQRDRYSVGYVIKLRDKDREIGDKEKQDIKSIEKYINNTGHLTEQRPNEDRRNFDTFLRLITRDTLMYNPVSIECVGARAKGRMAYFIPVSSGTIRYAVKDLKDKIKDLKGMMFNLDNTDTDRLKNLEEAQKNIADIKYVQVYKGQVMAAYTYEDLIYKHRVPSVEIPYRGYPPAELEWLLNTVASHRISEIHNEVFFKQGHANNGILNIKSELTEQDMQGIRRMLQRQSAGVRNAWRQLLFNAPEGIEWLPMSSMSNRDMEWYQWMTYLIRLICAVYGINPAEINFDISRDGGGSLGDSGSRNEVILKDTRNSILRPLLNWLQDLMNDDILVRFDKELADQYMFEFVGLDSQDEDVELDRIKKKVTTTYTINEVRKEMGQEELEYGDIILDPIYLQYMSQEKGLGEEGDFSPDGEENAGYAGEEVEEDVSEEYDDEVKEKKTSKKEEEAKKAMIKAVVGKDKKKAQKVLKKIKGLKKPLKIEWYD